MKRRTLAIASALVLVLFASGRLRAKDRAQSRTTGADENMPNIELMNWVR